MRGVVGALVVLATAAVGVPAASAGAYNVAACNAPGGHGVNNSWSWAVEVLPLGASPTPDDQAAYALTGNCAAPDGLRSGSNPGHAPIRWGTGANFTFQAPADTSITRVTLWRYGVGRLGADNPSSPDNESGRFETNANFGNDALSVERCHPGDGFYANPCTIGAPGFSDASKIVHDGRATSFKIGIFCGGDNGPFIACYTNDGAGGPFGFIDLQGALVHIEDTTAPAITAGGALISSGWRKPSDFAALNASDSTGIRAARLDVDGRVLTRKKSACDYTRPVPCPASVRNVRFAGNGIADGSHTLRLVAEDAAGNDGIVQRSVLVDGTPPTAILKRARGKKIVLAVKDPASGVASTSVAVRNHPTDPYRPLKSTFTNGTLRATLDQGLASRVDIRVTVADNAGNVSAGNPTRLSTTSAKVGRVLHRVRGGRVRIPFGRNAKLRGRLSLSTGGSLASQTVFASSTVRKKRSKSVAAGSGITDRHGRFSINVPAGPSRAYRVVFGGAPGALATARGLSIRVPASSTINASRTRLSGGRVRFSGRLRGRGLPVPRGLVIVLQGREGGKWRTFEDARTHRKGRWHVSYHFSGRPGSYPIRVRIRRQAGFPFELGYSRRLTIRVG
jgi:hypothetical protein